MICSKLMRESKEWPLIATYSHAGQNMRRDVSNTTIVAHRRRQKALAALHLTPWGDDPQGGYLDRPRTAWLASCTGHVNWASDLRLCNDKPLTCGFTEPSRPRKTPSDLHVWSHSENRTGTDSPIAVTFGQLTRPLAATGGLLRKIVHVRVTRFVCCVAAFAPRLPACGAQVPHRTAWSPACASIRSASARSAAATAGPTTWCDTVGMLPRGWFPRRGRRLLLRRCDAPRRGRCPTGRCRGS